MTKVLNIANLAKKDQELKIDGESYPMKQMSVSDFLELTKRAEVIDATKGESLITRVEFLVETVCLSFPTCPPEVLTSQTMTTLNAIVDFARDGSIPAGATESEGVEVEKKMEKQS